MLISQCILSRTIPQKSYLLPSKAVLCSTVVCAGFGRLNFIKLIVNIIILHDDKKLSLKK